MRAVAWDSWAFLEVALGFARRDEVERLWLDAEAVVTSREVVAETFNFITGRARGNARARDWLAAVRASQVQIVDASFEDLATYMEAHPEATRLGFTDFSLAFAAEQAGARVIATTDRGFRPLGFQVAFAPPE